VGSKGFSLENMGENSRRLTERLTIFRSIFFTVTVALILFSSPGTAIDGPIKTIVVLVLENRSFDHVLGWMKRLNSEIDGVTGQEWNPVSTNDPNSAKVYFRDDAEYVDPDPGHTFEAVREQVFGSNHTSADPPPMNGFV